MIVKMMITFDYNPETNEYTPVKQEIVKDTKAKTVTPKPEIPESSEPQVILESNKYILNSAAVELLQAKWEDRIDIKYQMVDKIKFPIIGKAEVWGTKSGNKLTKSSSVSYRGSYNSMLSEYGNIFTLTPWKGHEGLYILNGNKETITDINIEVPSDNVEEDIKEEIKEEDVFDIEEPKELDSSDFEISNYDFNI